MKSRSKYNERIRKEGLENSKVMDIAFHITDAERATANRLTRFYARG